MAKKSNSQHKRAQRNLDKQDSMPLSALVGLASGFFLAFVFAEIALGKSIHPLHWGVALAGAAAGYLVGLLYTRLKSTS